MTTPGRTESREKSKGNYRVCSCGCQKPLLKENGDADFSRRRFFGPDCKKKDVARRVAAWRATPKFQEMQQRKLRKMGQVPVTVVLNGEKIIVASAKAAFELVAAHGTLGSIEVMKIKRGRRPKQQ